MYIYIYIHIYIYIYIGRARARACDFESRARSGAAWDPKVNGFQLKTFGKPPILSAGPGRERPGIKKSTVFNLPASEASAADRRLQRVRPHAEQ